MKERQRDGKVHDLPTKGYWMLNVLFCHDDVPNEKEAPPKRCPTPSSRPKFCADIQHVSSTIKAIWCTRNASSIPYELISTPKLEIWPIAWIVNLQVTSYTCYGNTGFQSTRPAGLSNSTSTVEFLTTSTVRSWPLSLWRFIQGWWTNSQCLYLLSIWK